ncbi:MAG: segregation/condensation protein A [bacterium]|nr:segregation/condensation protein A [bacterium]
MKIKLEQFDGPFDLLLSLINDNKLNINEISLSDITEQYLQYLDKLEKNKEEELADFLVVGTRLLYLKSRLLLPQFAPEVDEGQSLEEQLRLYKAFVESSRKVNKLWENKYRGVFRVEPPRVSKEFVVPINLNNNILHDNMVQLLRRLKPLKPLPETKIDRAVSMKERLDKIRAILKKTKRINFFELLDNANNRTEIIVSFLALLELVKQKTVVLKQDTSFADIAIERV